MAKSTALSNSILDHFVGNSTWTAPSSLWVALTVSGSEVTSGNAARVEVPTADWNAAASGEVTNSATVTFPEGGGDAVPDGFAIYDASSGGNELRTGTLDSSFTWGANVTPEFDPGNLSLTES